MTVIRQDAWSEDDDLILAEVVLRHIREGSTQLAAFEEVGERLSRTSAACGFRWNSTVRKKYEAAIELAKKQRAAKRKANVKLEKEEQSEELVPKIEVKETEREKSLTMEEVIQFLKDYHNRKEVEGNESIAQLKEENERLKKELEQLKEKQRIISEDYRTLLGIMERARKLSFTDEVSQKS